MVTLSSSAFGAEAVRIGVITDMSGPYADLVGPGFVTAVRMATEDFGGKVLDRPIEVLAADDQTKPDIAVTKAREWYDRNDVQVLFEVLTPPLRLPCRDLVSKEGKSLSCFPVRAL